MDKQQYLAFILWEFRRLGMYEGESNAEKKLFIDEIQQGRTPWWVMCRVVQFVECRLMQHYGSVI